MSGGGQKTLQTIKQSDEPWAGAKGPLQDVYGWAKQAFAQNENTQLPAQTYAGPTADQQTAVSRLANSNLDSGAAGINKLANDEISGKYLSPDSNPFLKSAVNSAQQQTWDNFNRQVLPGLNSQAIQQGAYGGARNGLAVGQAAADAQRNALDIANTDYMQNYGNERNIQQQAPGLYDAANQLTTADINAQGQAGTQEQSWQQALLDDALNRYHLSLAAPWQGLGEWANILNGGGFSTSTQQSQVPRSSSIFQGAGSGMMLGNLMGGDSNTQAILAALGAAGGY